MENQFSAFKSGKAIELAKVLHVPIPAGVLEAEILTKIDFPNLGVIKNALGIAVSDNLALTNNVGALSDVERFPDVVIGDQHTDAALFEMRNDRLDIRYGDRINPGKWLIE